MRNLENLLEDAVEIIRRSGLPKQSSESDELFLFLLEEASRKIRRFKGENTASSIRRRLAIARRLSALKKMLLIADGVANTTVAQSGVKAEAPFDIGVQEVKALSLKMFKRAQELPIGDVAAWLRVCRTAESAYKKVVGGNLTSTYVQVKSDIKRMMKRNMNLRLYITHSEAKKVLLEGC